MTEAQWHNSTDLTMMLEFLKGRRFARKFRLFACACCRRVWPLLTDTRSQRGIQVSERYADGSATPRELRNAWEDARQVPFLVGNLGTDFAIAAAREVTTKSNPRQIALLVTGYVRNSSRYSGGNVKAEAKAQANLLRDMFGPLPYRAVRIDARWQSPTVVSIAQAIYDNCAFDRLPILADTLEDAGCDDADLLAHCRSGGEHVRGCWVVDLLLGKE